jgi:hypothetical protein
MSTTELNSILATVEAIRQANAPSLSAELLRAVVEAEELNPEDEPAAIQAIERAVKAFLAGASR